MSYRVRNIALAIGLAVIAALLTVFYVSNYKKSVRHELQSVTVLVAAKDIVPGTTGADVLARHLLSTRQVVRSAVVPGAISSPQQVAGLVATQPVYAGEQVTARRFGPVAASGVRSQLTGVFRAVQIAGDSNQLLSGTIHAGDHIDLIANVKVPDESSSKHFDRVVLRDLLVLKTSGVPTGTAKIATGTGGDSWVMLRVTDSQSQKLLFVHANEEWSLALRPTLNDADSPSNLLDSVSLLGDGLKGVSAAGLQATLTASQGGQRR